MEKPTINGKHYPLWSQFIERKDEWIGSVMEDLGDNMDRQMGIESITTKITAIDLRPNGDDSAFFEISGEEYSCGFDVKYGGVMAGDEGWITFSGYLGHTWRIKQP